MRAVEEVARGDRALAACRADVIVASSATAAAVSSAQGRRKASEPPTVPRWRVARYPAWRPASRRSGSARAARVVDERCWRTVAPTLSSPSRSSTPVEARHAVDVDEHRGFGCGTSSAARGSGRPRARACRRRARAGRAPRRPTRARGRRRGPLHQTAVVASGSGGFALSRNSRTDAFDVFASSSARGARRPTRRRAARRPSRSRGRRYTTSWRGSAQRRLRAARLNVRAAARTRPSTRAARGSVDSRRVLEDARPATAGRATRRSRGVRAWRPGSSHRASVPRATVRRAPPTGRGASCFR